MLLVASHHIKNLGKQPPTPWGTVGRVPMVLGAVQTLSNVISDEKTAGNII